MYTIEINNAYICVLFSGKVNDHELLTAFKEEVSLPEYHLMNDLWQFDGCECNFSHSSFNDLISYISTKYPRNATRMKTAIVTSSFLHLALGELFRDEADKLSYSIRIFQDLSKADAWLRE